MSVLQWVKLFVSKVWLVFLGIVIGGLYTKNKYIWWLLITYTIVMLVFNLIASRIIKIQNAADKKMELRNQGIQAYNDYVSYVEKAILFSHYLFDRYFPILTFFISFGWLGYGIWLVWSKQYLYGALVIYSAWVLIILNNMWRKIKLCN